MIKTRQITTTEEYAVCDLCGDEIGINCYNRINETCSHCGKHICDKHWDNECLMGEGEDTWILCPDCSKLVDIKDEPNEDVECGRYYFPVMKTTGERMELKFW